MVLAWAEGLRSGIDFLSDTVYVKKTRDSTAAGRKANKSAQASYTYMNKAWLQGPKMHA